MVKFYNYKHYSPGNRWMLLGSTVAKVLNTRDFPVGSEIKMTRVTYTIHSDGSIRRTPPKARHRRRAAKFSLTEKPLTYKGQAL